MWNETKFEKHVKKLLELDLGAKGLSLYSSYVTTRTKILGDVASRIPGAEPNLSDHGPTHIANVLENARYLLSTKREEHCLSGMDLYCLCMIILFHDVGNIWGRSEHHKNIAAIYDYARGTDPSLRREKSLILQAVRAHTGDASDGTLDTLKNLRKEDEHLNGEAVQLQSLAAILRFADELAEGPQRTSQFMRTAGLYADSSEIHHTYASITHIRADRGTERVSIKYEIDIINDTQVEGRASEEALRKILGFAYKRVIKLNQERQYARFYSKTLVPFKRTSISFNFYKSGEPIYMDLNPLIIEDKVVPGDTCRELQEHDSSYNIDSIVPMLMAGI